ncbi:MAG: VWA domain-containing protein, partial [Planctomycetota bacterium]
MTLLDPAAVAWAAALTVPPLVLLYFLKLRREKRFVPSTLLWRKAVEDLQVNAPFQRLRSSVLFWLQLLALGLAAFGLGKPMFRAVDRVEGTAILLIDRSASMTVVEDDGRTRLDIAKEQAKRAVDNLADDARAMVIAFADRPQIVSAFDSDKQALKHKIDSIRPTQASSRLADALRLAEAYSENILIGTPQAGGEIAAPSEPLPAAVFLFTDGRVEDASTVAIERLDPRRFRLNTVGRRSDNVGIVSMGARRNYEEPDRLQVTATVRNFGPDPAKFEVVLYVDDRLADVRDVSLQAGRSEADGRGAAGIPAGSVGAVSFDEIALGGGGIVEVRLRIDDALSADNRAWAVVP